MGAGQYCTYVLPSAYYFSNYLNTHSINCTPVIVTAVPVTAAAVTAPKLLHGSFLSPQISQIQFSPISRGGINWLVCRSNSIGTLDSTYKSH